MILRFTIMVCRKQTTTVFKQKFLVKIYDSHFDKKSPPEMKKNFRFRFAEEKNKKKKSLVVFANFRLSNWLSVNFTFARYFWKGSFQFSEKLSKVSN